MTHQSLPGVSGFQLAFPYPWPESDSIQSAWQSRTGSNMEESKKKKSRPRNPHFDAVAEACGISHEDLPVVASHVAKVAVLLKSFPPEEIIRRANIYRLKYPGFSLTPGALQKNWPECKEVPIRFTSPDMFQRIKSLKQAIRNSRAFTGGPYHTTLAVQSDHDTLKAFKEEILSLSPNFNFNELRD